jgi:hypothetical protein
MTAAQIQIEETEQERVARWRTEALEKAGYTPEAAAELAVRPDVDLHRAIGLIESGCPAETALRILL